MNAASSSDWKAPVGPWRAGLGLIDLAPGASVRPGVDYNITVRTLCGREDVVITAQPKEAVPLVVFVRQVQLVASIQHVRRRACRLCAGRYGTMLTPFERRFVYATEPQLGPVVGVNATGDLPR